MGEITDNISSIMQADGAALYVKAGLVIILIIAYIWYTIKSRKAAITQARNTEQASATQTEQTTTTQSTTVNNQIQADVQSANDFLNNP